MRKNTRTPTSETLVPPDHPREIPKSRIWKKQFQLPPRPRPPKWDTRWSETSKNTFWFISDHTHTPRYKFWMFRRSLEAGKVVLAEWSKSRRKVRFWSGQEPLEFWSYNFLLRANCLKSHFKAKHMPDIFFSGRRISAFDYGSLYFYLNFKKTFLTGNL